ncbi:MAG TPA: phosphoglycerate kinase [Chloroflexota bacterium]|nr:phosphoglycerate kinase [Chloroflexota bacterium]
MKRSIRDLDVQGKTVLVRVDYNVPLDNEGRVADATRIEATLPTINYLREHGAKTVLMAHFGRPRGKADPKYSLKPVAEELRRQSGIEVPLAPDCVGPDVGRMVTSLQPGQVLLLENVRFHPEEEKNDPAFSQQLASLGDLYVNDAFGAAHRAHASTAGVTEYLPSAAGFLMHKELEVLGGILENPKRPFVAIVGGAKVSSKLGVLESMLKRVDRLLIGGGMANTFLKARGLEVGKSLLEPDLVETAADLDRRAREKGVTLLLPEDVIVAVKVAEGAVSDVVDASAVPPDRAIVDIGPKARAAYAKALEGAGTVLWNGPMGVFEIPDFAEGTRAVAQALADSDATTVIGGGESVAAVEQLGLADQMTHISTGGGASLELLEGRELPGVAALDDA